MRLIVGLGNYPDKYHQTRHNIGFLFVEYLARHHSFTAWKHEKKFFGEVTHGQIGSHKVMLLKPHTLMNLSGKSVGAVAHFYKIHPENITIISDDIDQDFGNIRFREKGGSGGHNGLKSIIAALGTEDFPRLKFGIANDMRWTIPTEKFVLQKFSKAEQEQLEKLFAEGMEKFEERW